MIRIEKLLAIAVLLALMFAAPACKSNKGKKDAPEDTIKGAQRGGDGEDPVDMDAPSEEELADSPCGNPDWAKLPNGMDPEEADD